MADPAAMHSDTDGQAMLVASNVSSADCGGGDNGVGVGVGEGVYPGGQKLNPGGSGSSVTPGGRFVGGSTHDG